MIELYEEDLYLAVEEDFSQAEIEKIKKNYIYDNNKVMLRLIYHEEKNNIDSNIYRALFIITVPCCFIYGINILTDSYNLFNLICYMILILLSSHLIAGFIMILISCIFSRLIQENIIPLIISRKYR